MLSRLYRKAQALDGACLRAWGYPGDQAVREELLSALEWDSALQIDHARPAIRLLYSQLQTRSVELSNRLRTTSVNHDALSPQLVTGLRETLGALIRLVETVQQTATPSYSAAGSRR